MVDKIKLYTIFFCLLVGTYFRRPKFDMMHIHTQAIAQQLNIKPAQALAVLELLAEGATIPFIARYRKDKTNNLDEVQVQQIQELNKQFTEFADRKTVIEKTIAELGKMTPELQQKLDTATTLAALEDIYLPYKPKRKTKAQTARENGLEPLALQMLTQDETDLEIMAASFITENVTDADAALQGARDIVAEMINEDANVRAKMRRLFEETAILQSKVMSDKETEGAKYKDYFDFSEPIAKVPSHRILAILRGFLEGVLRIAIEPVEEEALYQIETLYVKGMSKNANHLKRAIKDAYRRLLQPSLETECRTFLKTRADEEAINVFAENLRQLLLSSPLGSKRILAIDPGYRTGCKVVCLDEKGTLQHTTIIYPHENNKRQADAATIKHLVKQYQVVAFAIGDGTAGRETERFVKELETGLPVFLVNEDGASIYSASEIARQEFPDQDITVRGAVSIGRRLMDPLAELVKIDPKSIGVGQYQHDVNQARLKEKLDATVISCVNNVGVNINTASKHLLAYVSGIGSSLADNIVKHREQIGRFNSRRQLLDVPRLGAKAYEQCAGFLRIKDGEQVLDNSAVHPEAYLVVQQMAKDLSVGVEQLVGKTELLQQVDAKKYATEQVGVLTIKDILTELQKPGLDPRSEVQAVEFAGIYNIEDVQVGMEVPGVVTNLTRFGAFIDIGVKQDGLVHVSEIANRYVSDPSEALKLNQAVKVKVLEVDMARKRIALSIKQTEAPAANMPKQKKPSHGYPKNTATTSAPKEVPLHDALAALKKKFR
jgi:uncharacterized protein